MKNFGNQVITVVTNQVFICLHVYYNKFSEDETYAVYISDLEIIVARYQKDI